MSLPTGTKNAFLDGEDFDQLSVHTAFPGVIGSSEVTGGTPAYAKQSVSFAPASGGTRILSTPKSFNVPACTVRWIGLWSSGAFAATAPNGGATPKNFSVMPLADMIVSTSHGYTDGTKVTFYQGTPPIGLAEGAVYFVRESDADTFKVAATSGGDAIALASGASFGCVVCQIEEKVFAAQGVHTVQDLTVAVPD